MHQDHSQLYFEAPPDQAALRKKLARGQRETKNVIRID